METKLYEIILSGCDADTEILMNLNSLELELLKKMKKLVNKIGGGCKPTMDINLLK